MSPIMFDIIIGSIARSAKRRYLSYSEANFEVSRPSPPQGRHIAPMGVKFGMEEGIDPRAVAVSRYGWLTTSYGWLAG